MLIACDTETGGLKPDVNPILSIAFYNDQHQFYVQIQGPKEWCDKRALEVNGLDPTQGVTVREAQKMIIAWWVSIGSPKLELIGHNIAAFDVSFIKQLALPDKMIDYHYRDTFIAAALLKDSGKVPLTRLNLGACCEYFGITFAAHNALEDAKAAWLLWNKMINLIKGV